MKTKFQSVKDHLQKKGLITSWEAIEKYGATRLSAYIFKLRKHEWDITSERVNKKDRNGNSCSFVKYKLNK